MTAHPGNHRWRLGRPYAHGPTTISIIEPGDPAKSRDGSPFGFGRVLEPEVEAPVEVEPLLWEGD